jgi:diadenosine tetraphosphate (Ap4A) HIT family hydrolase
LSFQVFDVTEEKRTEKVSSKKDDNSLDALLSGEVKKEIVHPNPRKDDDEIKIEKDDGIQIEKKENEPNKKYNIEIIKEEKIEEKKEEPQVSQKEIPKNVIYKDNEITVEIVKNAKLLGDLKVTSNTGKKISELNEKEISYMLLFSKVFSTILFDSMQAHGTNLIWSHSENCLHIIPRFQDDNLNINWQGESSSEEFLEQIREKLLVEMNSDVLKPSEHAKQDTEKIIPKSNEPNVKKKKVEHILHSLTRIP